MNDQQDWLEIINPFSNQQANWLATISSLSIDEIITEIEMDGE